MPVSIEIVYHDDIQDYSTNEPTLDGAGKPQLFCCHLCKREGIKSCGLDETSMLMEESSVPMREKNKFRLFLRLLIRAMVLGVFWKFWGKCDVKGSFFFTGRYMSVSQSYTDFVQCRTLCRGSRRCASVILCLGKSGTLLW